MNLRQCIDIAIKENIAIQRARLGQSRAEIDLQNARMARLPNLSSSVNNNFNFGRTINPFTNTFETSSITSVSLGASSNMVVFNGFRLNNSIDGAQLELEAQESIILTMENQVSLDVAALYLQVLMAAEQIKVFLNNRSQTESQLKRIRTMIDAGVSTKDKELELNAQLSNDEASLIQARNSYQMALMNLRNYLNLPLDRDLNLVRLKDEVAEIDTSYSLASLIQENYDRLPRIERDEKRLKASELDLKSAMGARYPSLFVGANLNSVYSTRSQLVENTQLKTIPIGYVEGSNEAVLTQQLISSYYTPGMLEQFENNFGQSFGFSLSIPIFNRNQINSGVEIAQINNQQNRLQIEQTKNDIRNEVYRAHQDRIASWKSYQAALRAFEAQELLFRQSQARYEAGTINYFDWLTIRNNKNAAKINLLRARYDYMFKNKTFDFYLGKEISL